MNRIDLKNYKYIQEWIKGRTEYLEEYKTTITSITNTISDMPKGNRKVPDSTAEKIIILLDSVDELLDKVIKENNKQKEILNQLDKVKEPYKLILDKLYIQGKSLVTVANEMNYSYEHMKHMHGIALLKFDEIGKIK